MNLVWSPSNIQIYILWTSDHFLECLFYFLLNNVYAFTRASEREKILYHVSTVTITCGKVKKMSMTIQYMNVKWVQILDLPWRR